MNEMDTVVASCVVISNKIGQLDTKRYTHSFKSRHTSIGNTYSGNFAVLIHDIHAVAAVPGE